MSIDATRWAWRQQGLTSSQKITLLSLADRADERHACFPSVNRLAQDTCLDRKTVMKCIQELEKLGMVSVRRADGSGNIYQLNGVEDRHETSTKNGTGPKIGTGTKSGTAPVPKLGRDQYQNWDTNLSRTYQEPINNISTRNSKKALFELLSSYDVTGQLAEDFINHRKTKRASITETALIGFKREAQKAGVTLQEAIAMSIERGWTGFNADWITTTKQRGGYDEQRRKRDEEMRNPYIN